jgi:hypothetical protein
LSGSLVAGYLKLSPQDPWVHWKFLTRCRDCFCHYCLRSDFWWSL